MPDLREIRSRGAVVVAALAAALTLGGCGTDSATPGSQPPSSASTVRSTQSAVVADSDCQQTPPSGHIDRSGMDLNFHHGQIRVAVAPIPATPTPSPVLPAPAPAPAPAPVPVPATSAVPTSSSSVSASPAPSAPATPTSKCFGFTRWGNNDPAVPPDSLLFSFKGEGDGGAQVSFFVGDLTGGGPPPAGGDRRVVPPLVAPINAQIGVSAEGTYYQATQCSLKITAMSAARAAGFFQCPTATSSKANPFDPSDDVSYDSDESSTAAANPTTTTEQARMATLSGWFSVSK